MKIHKQNQQFSLHNIDLYCANQTVLGTVVFILDNDCRPTCLKSSLLEYGPSSASNMVGKAPPADWLPDWMMDVGSPSFDFHAVNHLNHSCHSCFCGLGLHWKARASKGQGESALRESRASSNCKAQSILGKTTNLSRDKSCTDPMFRSKQTHLWQGIFHSIKQLSKLLSAEKGDIALGLFPFLAFGIVDEFCCKTPRNSSKLISALSRGINYKAENKEAALEKPCTNDTYNIWRNAQ